MTVTIASRATSRRANTVTLGAATGATINQKLRGSLHPFGFPGPLTPAARTFAAVNLNRTDKFLSVTPIKAGAVDATHPTLGHSGLYSYDWRVVDRAMADIAADGTGMEAYISLDACPQILGGSVAPYSGSDLTGVGAGSPQYGMAGYASYPAEIPNNLASYANMCVDLIDHILVGLGSNVAYWGVHNEPDGGQYWSGTAAQYFALFAAVSNAVKAYNPAIKIGGPEAVDPYNHFAAWIQAFLSYCKTNSVACDFISVHDYGGTHWIVRSVTAQLARAKTAVGWATPLDVIVGEWNVQLNNGQAPFVSSVINDSAAAAVALQLMEMQLAGVSRAIFFKSTYDPATLGDFSGGLTCAAGSWTPNNVFKMWARMGAGNVLATTVDAAPGVHVLAASDSSGSGKLYVLVSNYNYRRGPAVPVTVSMPGVADGRSTTLWMIDQAHSNQYDAGLTNAELQTVPVANTVGGKVTLMLASRSVGLLVVAP